MSLISERPHRRRTAATGEIQAPPHRNGAPPSPRHHRGRLHHGHRLRVAHPEKQVPPPLREDWAARAVRPTWSGTKSRS